MMSSMLLRERLKEIDSTCPCGLATVSGTCSFDSNPLDAYQCKCCKLCREQCKNSVKSLQGLGVLK